MSTLDYAGSPVAAPKHRQSPWGIASCPLLVMDLGLYLWAAYVALGIGPIYPTAPTPRLLIAIVCTAFAVGAVGVVLAVVGLLHREHSKLAATIALPIHLVYSMMWLL